MIFLATVRESSNYLKIKNLIENIFMQLYAFKRLEESH